MKNISIVIVFLIILIAGAVFAFGTGKKAEAPKEEIQRETQTQVPTSTENPASPLPTVKEFTVSGANFSFAPSFITVKRGDKVKITFENSAGFHDFVIDEYGVATKQTQAPTTEVLEFTADKVGSFEYYCSVGSHRAMGMKGTLKVE